MIDPMETFPPWTPVRRDLKQQVITPLDAPQAFLDEARRERCGCRRDIGKRQPSCHTPDVGRAA
jgi:hypothetical protein